MRKGIARQCAGLTIMVALAAALGGPGPCAAASECFGTTSRGRLAGGVALPAQGKNFRSYSVLGSGMGRTHVHSRVRDVVLAAYAELADTVPDHTWVYGETGWPTGGPFWPHKTHQNGLSVDFMVPVRDAHGRPVLLPMTAANRYGYSEEFDGRGLSKNGQRIDFEAMAAHLLALARAAEAAGIGIRLVIFDPLLQRSLWRTSAGAELRRRLRFSRGRVWVRHDEHYHVDFELPCRPYAEAPKP